MSRTVVYALRRLLLFWLALAWLAAPAHAQQDEHGWRGRAERLRTLGEAYVRAGDHGSAMAYFREAIAADPLDADSYLAIGKIYAGRGQPSDAAEAYRRGLARRPEHAALWRSLAAALQAEGRLEDAADALRSLVRRAPMDVEGQFLRAELARRRGNWAEALAAYRAVLDLMAAASDLDDPRLEEARRYVEALKMLIGRLDPVSAVSCQSASEVRRALAHCTGD